MAISEALRARLLEYQRNQITEHHIYRRLAEIVKEPENARVLAEIAADERRHYDEWKVYTGQDVPPGVLTSGGTTGCAAFSALRLVSS